LDDFQKGSVSILTAQLGKGGRVNVGETDDGGVESGHDRSVA